MGGKARRPGEARIDVTEGDYRWNTRERRGKKEGEFVYKVASRLLIGSSALIDFRRQIILRNAQFVTEEVDLVSLSFEISKFLVGQNEVKEDIGRASCRE